MKVTKKYLLKLIRETINNQVPDQIDIKISNIPLTVSLANDEELRHKGLMHKNHLENNNGMLFIHDVPEICKYTMKNTNIPLSIAFADEKGEIFQIEDMNPGDVKSAISIQPALYALEMNKGWYSKNNIEIGSKIDLYNSSKIDD